MLRCLPLLAQKYFVEPLPHWLPQQQFLRQRATASVENG
jgi:hypothetical protein